MSFFSAIWEWITWAFSLLSPFESSESASPTVRRVILFLIYIIFLGVLFAINYFTNLAGAVDHFPRFLSSEPTRGMLRYTWLPILGTLAVLIVLVLYWFYVVWFTELDESPFPDIDAAWNEAIHALAQVRISLPTEPLFLVLGRPETLEQHLFEAGGIKLAVKQTPADPDAPIHVFASKDAIYVTCRGASVLGKLAAIFALEETVLATPESDVDEELLKTMRAGSKDQAIVELLRATPDEKKTQLWKRASRRASLGKPLGNDLLSDAKQMTLLKRRLIHLCRLIARDRQPHCPVNGILLLIPIAGTDTPEEAQLTAHACQADLKTVRDEWKLECPVVSVVVDMEELPGFVEFIEGQPPSELGNRRGQGFPMSTRLSREEILDEIRKSITFVCTTYMQDSVYSDFQTETPTESNVMAFFPGNAKLMVLLDEMNRRCDALNVIVEQAIGPMHDPLFRYSGCYFAATGSEGQQAFIAGVLQKLVREQSSVAWTQAALDADSQCYLWSNLYFVLSIVFFCLCALLTYLTFFQVT
ncbi:MAG: hypothetical protein FJ303_11345 [Planctomycetes bacterium]|nr:hypothetical protein [Planctomycetota bacterium]